MNSQRSVLHITSSLNYGGYEVLISDIIQNSHHVKFDLHVISNEKGPLYKNIRDIGFQISFHKRKGIDHRFIRFLRKYLKGNEIDIIHVHDTINGWNALLASLFLGTKIVFTVHGWGRSRIKYLLMKFMDQICYVSNSLKIHINADYPDKEFILYNGISLNKFNNSNLSVRKELHIHKREFLFGFVGNFNTVRDQLTVCKALRLVKKKKFDFTFLFVGAAHIPKLYDACYSYCEKHDLLDNIKFLGSRSDVPEILSSLDLFVYSSNQDTFGIAVVEAMMSGTPVIVNDLAVFKEITEGGLYARLYKTKDEVDLSNKIIEMMSCDQNRFKLGKKAKNYAIDNYSIEKHIASLNELYSNLLQK